MLTPISQVTSWQDLQDKVRDFFKELGYDACTNKPISLANNANAVVDVFAVKGDSPLAQKILFECKYWNSDVPRAIVQSFKMDVQEAGANFGIIVSKQGFQSGAYQGISLTTVKLYTFEELQKVFAQEWAEQNLRPLVELRSSVIRLARHFEFATPERDFYESTLFNTTMKALHDDLWASVHFPLALFNDYFTKDALASIPTVNTTFTTPKHDGCPRIANFHDVRTMARCLKSLFEHAIARWENYQHTYQAEMLKLPPDQLRAHFNPAPTCHQSS